MGEWIFVGLIWSVLLAYMIVAWLKDRARQKVAQAAWEEWGAAARDSFESMREGRGYIPIRKWEEPT